MGYNPAVNRFVSTQPQLTILRNGDQHKDERETDGDIEHPGVLYQNGSTYYLQTDDTLVLERQ